MNRQGRKLAIFPFNTGSFDPRAHLLQRFNDAAHRPAGQRFITEDPAEERLGGQQTGHHANGRTRVAGVQIAFRLLPATESAALNGDGSSLLFDFNSERADAAERRMAVRPGGIIGDFRRAFRKGRDHCIAVGNRFIARQCDEAGKAPRGANSLSHEAPL